MDDFSYRGLKALVKKHSARPLFTMEVLNNDPFTAGSPARLRDAEWLADLWHRRDELGVNLSRKLHPHGFHYVKVSQPSPILMPSGRPYENTRPCERIQVQAATDARILGLIPLDAFIDRRSPEATIFDIAKAIDPEIEVTGDLDKYTLPSLKIPKLEITAPTILQPFHLEYVIEKSTQNDIAMPCCESDSIDFQPGLGEFSFTRCLQITERAKAHHPRPTRVAYVSDFDPGGVGMPVAVARKIEFFCRTKAPWLDIEVHPIALTPEQCIELRLPSIPMKEGEKRAPKFKERYGVDGAVELDALEALHPGKLEELIKEWADRYRDRGLADRIADVIEQVKADLEPVNDEVRARHADAIATLKSQRRQRDKKIKELNRDFEKKAAPVLRAIENDLVAEAPDLEDYAWPTPEEGDVIADPMFDSKRDFLDQCDRYKRHQRKPSRGRDHHAPRTGKAHTVICVACGEPFEARRSDTVMCGEPKCRSKFQRMRLAGEVPPSSRKKVSRTCEFCGRDFMGVPQSRCCGSRDCTAKMRLDGERKRNAEKRRRRSD